MKKLCLSLLALILLLTVLPSVSMAGSSGKFILIVIDNLTLSDLENNNLPHLHQIVNEGGLGLMNTNTAGSRSAENTYSTIANGNNSLGTAYAGYAYNAGENVQLSAELKLMPAEDLYHVITGRDSTGEILQLGMPRMVAANTPLDSGAKVAVLGDTLKANGIRAGVFGNSDNFTKTRLAPLMAVDAGGQVAKGVISEEILQADKSFPFGFRTDYTKLGEEIARNWEHLDYIVIETGDTSRLEKYLFNMPPERYEKLKKETLQRIDSFLGSLITRVNWHRDRLMIISPTPSSLAVNDKNTITPIIFKGKDLKPGFLSSNSTRRQGIVANTDIAPTVLSFWNLPTPPEIVGRPVFSLPGDNTLASIKQLNQQLVVNYKHRPPVLKTFVVMQIIFLLFTSLIILFCHSDKILKFTRDLIIIFLILPLLMLGYIIFRVPSLALTTVQLILVLALVYWLLSRIKTSFLNKVAFLALLTSLGILLDTLLGAKLIMNSPMGYDAIAGARYYGIGNEFAGVLMGSTIIAVAAIFQEFSAYKKWLYPVTLLYFAFLTYVSYAPNLGADAGGLITAAIALGYFSLRLAGKHIRLKNVMVLLAATLVLLGLGAFIDMSLNQSKGSHIGQAFSLLLQGNWTEIVNIISRKISMNIKLLNYSIWTKVLLTSLAALGVLLYRPVGFFKQLADSCTYLKKGFEAIFVASLVGFVVNDSGIVQASTTFIYLMFPMLYLSLSDRLEKNGV